MEQAAPEWLGAWIGLSSIGFYIFLAVWVGMSIWSRTREKIAIQDTLRRLIDSGTGVSPEVIDALRRPKPKRSAAEIRASIVKYRYWGAFLVALGIATTLWSLSVSERVFPGIAFFAIPGLFCLAHSLITTRTQLPPQE
jgi:hypothetical protein